LNEERALQMNDKAVDFKNGGGSSLDAGRAFRCKCRVKVGHAGTLDPFATGLLVLAVGKSTKQIDTLMKLDKVYDVQLTLGATSNTDDIDGEIVSTGKSRRITDLEELKRVLTAFVGDMQQIPPVYSAIKVDGKRAYKRARDGEIVEMKPRQVTIRAITNIGYKHPVLSFQAEVSSGTYIRSLARDIGERLGQGAHVSALRRISVGDDSVHDALLMTELNSGSIHQFLKTDKLPLD
jgi:tRNA pseudouridine55 synthase